MQLRITAPIIGLTLLAAVASSSRGEEPAQVVEPLDIGFSETAETALLFLDVEAVDATGRPLPGLGQEDFKVRLDFVPRTIYSVDDLCPCSADTGELDPNPWNDPERLKLVLESTRPRFALYFDFSQLQYDGKTQALVAAERWVRYVMADDDRAQIVVHSEAKGLERLTPFTSDREALVAAIRAAGGNPDYDDPFPSDIWDRRERCAGGAAAREAVRAHAEARARGTVARPTVAAGGGPGGGVGDVACYYFARKEYFRIDRSLLNLRYFVAKLDDIPERKVVLYFHQNATAFPGKLYSFSQDGQGALMLDGQASDSVPDLARLMESLSGAATHSRTAIFPVVTGYGEVWSVNLGANVADATGGAHNLGAADADPVLDDAGRGCGCYYRIGFRAPSRGSHVYHVKVIAAGDKLPRRYRLQYLTEDDRWMQTAEAVLASAGDAHEVAMAAALRPIVTKGGWGLEVQVAVDVASLEFEPAAADDLLVGEWEAGALLVATGRQQNWELLNASRIRRAPDSDGTTLVLHTRTFEGLAPGEYELRAFARDRIGDVWGSARATVTLPDRDEPALIGPWLERPNAEFLPSDLPTRKKKRKAKGPAIRESRGGPVPLGLVAPGGAPLVLSAWVCPAAGAEERLQPTLLAGADVLEHEGEIEWSRAGGCAEARASFAPGELQPGAYTWRLDYSADGVAPLEAQREFEVGPDQ